MNRKLLLTLLLTCGSVHAAEWVSFGMSRDRKAEFYVDTSSIRIAGPVRQVWSKRVVSPYTEKGVADQGNKWVSSEITHWTFNCIDETSRIGAMTVYYTDGSDYVDNSETSELAPVAPDTFTELLMRFVCAWKPK